MQCLELDNRKSHDIYTRDMPREFSFLKGYKINRTRKVLILSFCGLRFRVTVKKGPPLLTFCSSLHVKHRRLVNEILSSILDQDCFNKNSKT